MEMEGPISVVTFDEQKVNAHTPYSEPAYVITENTGSQRSRQKVSDSNFSLFSDLQTPSQPWNVGMMKPPPGLEHESSICDDSGIFPFTEQAKRNSPTPAHQSIEYAKRFNQLRVHEQSRAWAWLSWGCIMPQPGFVYGRNEFQQAAVSARMKLPVGHNSENQGPTTSRKQRSRRCQLLLGSILNELQDEDADCIIFARRIQRLGFNSETILRNHYDQYGKVEKVLLSNAHDHAQCTDNPGNPRHVVRLRPSGLALILMADRESAAAIIAAGPVQRVEGVDVQVRRFERRFSTKDDVSEDDMDEDRRPSIGSDSTRSPGDCVKAGRCDSGSTRCTDSD
jgi:hypothetical protein